MEEKTTGVMENNQKLMSIDEYLSDKDFFGVSYLGKPFESKNGKYAYRKHDQIKRRYLVAGILGKMKKEKPNMKREKDYGTTFKFEGTDLDEAYKRYKNTYGVYLDKYKELHNPDQLTLI